MGKTKDRWSALSMQDRADLIKLYMDQGITNLMSMRKHYNGIPYADFNTSKYDYFNASPNMEPKKEGEHWGSRNPYTGQILKREDHPTFDLAVDGENKAGYVIRRGIDGNLYSLPQQPYNYVERNKFTEGGQKQTMSQASSAVAKKAFSKENVGGTIASGLGTAMTLVDNAMKNAEVDTSEADNALEATKSFQTDNSNLDALANSYNSAPWASTDVNFKDFVPGAGTQAMNALSSVTSGMSSGASMGGPWGAIAGAVVGLGSALAGTFAGRAKAKKEEARIENEAKLANMSLQAQAIASRDALLQQQANQNLMNIAAYGGKMNRFDNGGYKTHFLFKNVLDGTAPTQTLNNEEPMFEKMLTEEEFINNKRQEIINNSYNNSLNRTSPTVPMILESTENDFYRNRDFRAEVALENALNFPEGSEKRDWWMKESNNIKNEKYKDRLIPGDSCIYTATDNYGKKYRCASNEKFYNLDDYERGFKQIGVDKLQPGDLVMDGRGHMLTFDSYDKDGTMLFNYSNGGNYPEAIKVKSRYTGKKKDDSNLTYYRFVGNQEDNDNWKKEYFNYKKDYNRQLYEGLSAVNAAKNLELPQQAIMMSPESGIITTRNKPEQKLLTKNKRKKVK